MTESTEKTPKRRFYNTKETKGFTKTTFFQTVLDMANGEDVEENLIELVAAAAEYELEGIELKAAAKGETEKKDPLKSDYAVKLTEVFTPLLTAQPQTAEELVNAATKRGLMSPKGTPWVAQWVSRVFNKRPDLAKATTKVVEKTNAKSGLKAQKELTAFAKA
jgi:hypothetical protein